MMSFRHIALPARGTQYPDITGLQILQPRKVFATVDYAKQRRTMVLPYGRSGVSVIVAMSTFGGLPSCVVSAIDCNGEACGLPESFRFVSLYKDGSKRVCQTVT